MSWVISFCLMKAVIHEMKEEDIKSYGNDEASELTLHFF